MCLCVYVLCVCIMYVCMYGRMGFMTLISAKVLRAGLRIQYCECQCVNRKVNRKGVNRKGEFEQVEFEIMWVEDGSATLKVNFPTPE